MRKEMKINSNPVSQPRRRSLVMSPARGTQHAPSTMRLLSDLLNTEIHQLSSCYTGYTRRERLPCSLVRGTDRQIAVTENNCRQRSKESSIMAVKRTVVHTKCEKTSSPIAPLACPDTGCAQHGLLNNKCVPQPDHTSVRNYTAPVYLAKCMMFLMCLISLTVPISARNLESVRAVPQSQGSHSYETIPIDSTQYLSKFGYLPKSHMETGELRDPRELDNAVKKFQRMAHLPVTGRLDQNTVDKMAEPRCGVSDDIRIYINQADGSTRSKRYVLGPSTWPNKALTYRILNYTPDLQARQTREALEKAFRLWSDATELTFTEVMRGEADILVRFASRYHQDGYPFDGPGMTLAHAFFPGPDTGGDVHFDEDEDWTFGTPDGVNLYTVAAHELGHALGLGHSSVLGALMYPWYQGYNPDLTLHSDDLVAIQYLYGRGEPTDPRRTTTYPVQTYPTIPPTFSTRQPERSTTPTWNEDQSPNPCSTNLDAASLIRQEAYIFKGPWFWRLDDRGVMDGYPVMLNRFWYGLPSHIQHIDAVYERVRDGKIVFFSGDRFWILEGNELDRNFPKEGRHLSYMGFPDDIDHVDAAFVWAHNQRTYLVTGNMYWRYNEDLNQMDYDYPRDMSMWDGVPVPVDTAFQFWDGSTYFFQGTQYWKFQDDLMRTEYGYPQPLGPFWLECSQEMIESPGNSGPGTSSAQSLHYSPTTIALATLNAFIAIYMLNAYTCTMES